MDIQTDKKSKNEDIDMLLPIEQYIEVDDFFYQKDEIVAPHSSLWGDFNFSLNTPISTF